MAGNAAGRESEEEERHSKNQDQDGPGSVPMDQCIYHPKITDNFKTSSQDNQNITFRLRYTKISSFYPAFKLLCLLGKYGFNFFFAKKTRAKERFHPVKLRILLSLC